MPLTGLTHDTLPREKFDFRCSEMLCSGHVFASEKMTSARGPGLKCKNSIWRPHFKVVETLRSITIVRLVCGLLKEERYIAKATNSQYFTKSFTQKNVLLFALILTYGSIRFDSRNTYRVTGVTGYGFN